jgi:hypothetical protein
MRDKPTSEFAKSQFNWNHLKTKLIQKQQQKLKDLTRTVVPSSKRPPRTPLEIEYPSIQRSSRQMQTFSERQSQMTSTHTARQKAKRLNLHKMIRLGFKTTLLASLLAIGFANTSGSEEIQSKIKHLFSSIN